MTGKTGPGVKASAAELTAHHTEGRWVKVSNWSWGIQKNKARNRKIEKLKPNPKRQNNNKIQSPSKYTVFEDYLCNSDTRKMNYHTNY